MGRNELRPILREKFPTEWTYLLPALHYLQEEFGQRADWALHSVCWHLRVPASEVNGAATSYTELRIDAPGRTWSGFATDIAAGAKVDAVNASETYISQLCKDPDMKAIGACRTCLVQIDGVRSFPASCSVPAQEGMVVQTDTPEVRRIRSGVIELTLGMLPKERSAISHQP